MARTPAVGYQNFEDIITKQIFYVDKTQFIEEWWENKDQVTLIARPRRFGKTLNMSMLEQFFSVEYAGRKDLFEGLYIWEKEAYRNLQGSYPVISLTFANVKERNYENAKIRISQIITGLLLASGYLKVTSHEDLKDVSDSGMIHMPEYELALTNSEVKLMFLNMVREWFGQSASDYNDFIRALLAGNVKEMNAYMNRITVESFSSFDTGKYPQPERFYHGFVLGLVASLSDRYIVTSNRESGFGRYDVMLDPRTKEFDGIIMEFKVHDSEEEAGLPETAAAALAQIEEKIMLPPLLGKISH